MKGFFVTGTDTHVGKTVVCGLLAGFLRARGIDAVTQKWVQTGTSGWPADLATHRRIMGLPEDVPPEQLDDLCPYRLCFLRLRTSPRSGKASRSTRPGSRRRTGGSRRPTTSSSSRGWGGSWCR
jgi:dethiobiotin synthetase